MAGQVRAKRTEQGKSGRRGQGRQGEGNAKDNAGHSTLQEKVKDTADCAQGGGQGRTDYK